MWTKKYYFYLYNLIDLEIYMHIELNNYKVFNMQIHFKNNDNFFGFSNATFSTLYFF